MLKKIFKGIGLLLILGVIVLAFILIPPHMQIRGVSPSLPTQADLESLKESTDGPTKISYISTSTQKGDGISIGHSTFVVEWEDGKILLIDLGMDKKTAVEFGKLFENVAGADPAVVHGTLPEFLGDELGRVKGVAFTHLHQDHVQGIKPICGAGAKNINVLHTNDQMTKHNFNTDDQINMLKDSSCVEQKLLPNDTNLSSLFPGIGIYPLGGHTPGSTLFAIPIDGRLWLLSGDITNSKQDLLKNQGKGLIYSYIVIPEDEDRLEKLRLWLIDLDKDPNIEVVVSHDTAALKESGMNEWKR